MARTSRIFFKGNSGAAVVKNGFSWPAFLCGSLWAAAKRMWYPHFLALLVVDAVMWFGLGYSEASGMEGLALVLLAAMWAYAVVRGRYGNRWLAASLRRRGYEESRGGTAA